MEIQGRILKIGPVQTVGANGTFQKRELVLVTEEQYPQYLPIDFVQEKCSLLDNFQPNQVVKVSINLRGREWTNPAGEVKYFVSIQARRVSATRLRSTRVCATARLCSTRVWTTARLCSTGLWTATRRLSATKLWATATSLWTTPAKCSSNATSATSSTTVIACR